MIKICHITSVHPVYDVRIFHKECVSLVEAGFEVVLICSGKATKEFYDEGVKIIQVQAKDKGRILRMIQTVGAVYKAALRENALIYHLHDPELIRIIPKLIKKGKKVIYDAHEDLPLQITGKHWVPTPLRRMLSFTSASVLKHFTQHANAIVAATEPIAEFYYSFNSNVVSVKNYPLQHEFPETFIQLQTEKNVCYIGSISLLRGIKETVNAVCKAKTGLLLAGSYSPENLRQELVQMPAWKCVTEYGILDRKNILEILSHSVAGMVTLRPARNFIDSLPIKMFEYMAASLPVIASDFPLWKTIVEGNNCGLCVDPLNPDEIAGAISFILSNPDRAREMGANGRKAFLEKYNWETEKQKLIDLYKLLSC